MRSCAVSIPSNIAEGAGRLNTREYQHFLGIARGSHFELQTQLTIACKLRLADAERISVAENLSEEVGCMIFAMIRSLKEHQE